MRKTVCMLAALAVAALCSSGIDSAWAQSSGVTFDGSRVLVVGSDGIETAPINPAFRGVTRRGGSANTGGACDENIYENTPNVGFLNINVDDTWIADDCVVTQNDRKACRVEFGLFNNDAGNPIDSIDVVLFDACPQQGGQQIAGTFQTFDGPFDAGETRLEIVLPETFIPDTVWPATRVHLPNGHDQAAGALIAGAAEVGFTADRYSRTNCANTYGNVYAGMDIIIDGGFQVSITGACCNDISSQCTDDVDQQDCQQSGDRWARGSTCAELDPPCGQFNDECGAAELIECGSVTVFDNSGGTQNLQDDPFVCSPDGQGEQPDRTMFYKFVATATSATVSTCDTDENGATNTVLTMYRSCDLFRDELGCDHDRCDPHARLCVGNLTIGDEYTIMVSEAVGGAPGAITLNLGCTPECAVDPLGACCIDGGDLCFDLNEPDCRDNGGQWKGEGTACDDPDPCGNSCGTGDDLWDNNLTPDGFSGRAASPPNFPDIRIVDDFIVPNGLTWNIQDFHFNMIEDAGWTPGNTVEIYVRADSGSGGPVQGAGNELENVVRSTFTRAATGVQYFGRDDFEYCVLFEEDTFQLSGGTYWIGSRNPNGGGAGTNYWMTSDGGPDGPASTGWFSLDAGATFNDEGANWNHAFVVTGVLGEAQSGACCHGDGTCDDGIDGGDCTGEFDRFAANTLCENLDPPCSETTGGCCVEGGCVRNPEWVCDGDTDGDGQVNPVDSGLVQANFGSTDDADLCQYDVDCDGQINPVDSGIVQSLFGTCNAPRASCGGGGGGECVEVGPTECAARGGDFLGIGTDCTDDPCGLAPGACCEGDTCADGVREGDCGGTWFEGANCADDPCGLALGACCVDGTCVGNTRESDCAGRWFDGEDCGNFDCPNNPGCEWDNNMVPDGFSGRAISPPNFPDIRVVDDIDVNDCEITTLRANIIEDAGWTPGANITVYVYSDAGGSPQGGATFAEQTTTNFTRIATGDNYFGRDDFDYTVSGLSIVLPAGTYWVGTRSPNGGGAGTNYFMTSDGGPDGGGSSTGYFSLDRGATFTDEGAGWQHAFELLP